MLSPLLESQDTSPGPQFAAADLGDYHLRLARVPVVPDSNTLAGPGYPNATGPTLNPSLGVERELPL